VHELEELHPSARKVAEALIARDVLGPFLEFDATTKSAAEAARALDCDVGAIASCLVFVLDNEPVVIIKSGGSRVDLDEFAELVHGKVVRQATPEEVRAATGQPIGGVSPIGWPEALRVFIDDALSNHARVWSACGTPNAVFETTFLELKHLTMAETLSLGK
jgi:prolyl-tRNA editing enzyme YbaK/EbsC (Cys-tRNA(Pro) deacylase)